MPLLKRSAPLLAMFFGLAALTLVSFYFNPPAGVAPLPINGSSPSGEQPRNFKASDSAAHVERMPRQIDTETDGLDPMLVQELLSDVALHEDGRALRLDDQARRRMDQAIFMLGFGQSAKTLDLLDQLISNGLPETVGKDAAAIFRRYYEYKSVETEFLANSFEHYTALESFAQLVELRNSYLGPELTEHLFGEEQTYIRYSMAMAALQEDASLSSDERQLRQAQLRRQYYGD